MQRYIIKFKKGTIYGLSFSVVLITTLQLIDLIDSGFVLRNIWDLQKVLLIICIPVISFGLLALTPWAYICTDYSNKKDLPDS